LDSQITVQFCLGNPLVTDARQRFELAAFNQAENGFIIYLQYACHFFSGVNNHVFACAWLRGCLESSGHEAAHALV
jgi:hypothetical protein